MFVCLKGHISVEIEIDLKFYMAFNIVTTILILYLVQNSKNQERIDKA